MRKPLLNVVHVNDLSDAEVLDYSKSEIDRILFEGKRAENDAKLLLSQASLKRKTAQALKDRWTLLSS